MLSETPDDPRFKRLVFLLGIPDVYVIGHYECLLHNAQRTRRLMLGDSLSVEQIAKWQGKKKTLTSALVVCGRHLGRPGFIEPVGDLRGSFQLAEPPQYVLDRLRDDPTCVVCGRLIEHGRADAKYCGEACRSRFRRLQNKLPDRDSPSNRPVSDRDRPVSTGYTTQPNSTQENKMNTHPQPPQGGEGVVCEQLVLKWYQEWGSGTPRGVDHDKAGELIELLGDDAWAVIPYLVKVVRKRWPDCVMFSGALTYLPDALRALRAEYGRQEARENAKDLQRTEQAMQAEDRAWQEDVAARWEELPGPTQAEIRRSIMAEKPNAPEAFIRRLCLEELASRIRTGRL